MSLRWWRAVLAVRNGTTVPPGKSRSMPLSSGIQSEYTNVSTRCSLFRWIGVRMYKIPCFKSMLRMRPEIIVCMSTLCINNYLTNQHFITVLH